MNFDKNPIETFVKTSNEAFVESLTEAFVESSNEVLDKLGEEGYDITYGARPLKRVLQRRVLNELSKEVLSGKVQKDSVVMMELGSDGEIVFENIEAAEVVD